MLYEVITCVIKNNAIYVSGATSNSKYNALIAKYNLDGMLDSNFGNNGLIVKDFGTNLSSFANDLNFDSNNNLLVGYSYGSTSNYDFGLESYNANGVLNQNFGVNGVITSYSIHYTKLYDQTNSDLDPEVTLQ